VQCNNPKVTPFYAWKQVWRSTLLLMYLSFTLWICFLLTLSCITILSYIISWLNDKSLWYGWKHVIYESFLWCKSNYVYLKYFVFNAFQLLINFEPLLGYSSLLTLVIGSKYIICVGNSPRHRGLSSMALFSIFNTSNNMSFTKTL
jgi:hypothetical protein